MRFNSICNRCLLKLLRSYSSNIAPSSTLPVDLKSSSILTIKEDQNEENKLEIRNYDEDSKELWTPKAKAKFNKTYANKRTHVTAVNFYHNNDKSILQLRIPKGKFFKNLNGKAQFCGLNRRDSLKEFPQSFLGLKKLLT